LAKNEFLLLANCFKIHVLLRICTRSLQKVLLWPQQSGYAEFYADLKFADAVFKTKLLKSYRQKKHKQGPATYHSYMYSKFGLEKTAFEQ
jgi:hypothetical protein